MSARDSTDSIPGDFPRDFENAALVAPIGGERGPAYATAAEGVQPTTSPSADGVSIAPATAAVFRDALSIIRQREAAYAKGIRVTVSHAAFIDPARFCSDTLALSLADRTFLQIRHRRLFFAWASEEAPESRLLPVLACYDHLARGAIPTARPFAQRALYLNQDDLYAQSLYRRCHPELPAEPDLKGKFCSRPFEMLETQTRGRVFFCCTAWLPIEIGNLSAKTPDEIWNSPAAQDIRRSILDGSYRYCSRMHCPRLTEDDLPMVRKVQDPEHREIIAESRVELPKGPKRLFLSHDRSCNLSCPSCRTSMIVAKKDEVDRMNAMAERVILPLVKSTRRVQITGSGDPFASHHFRYVIKRLTSGDTLDVRIDLQTNGLLLKASWDDLGLEGHAGWVIVSIDAVRPETYAVLRQGGRFEVLLENLEFLSQLRRENRVKHVRLDMVVQALNFRQMPEAVDLMRTLGFDGVKFQMIRSWNTYTAEEFAKHDIGCPDHPEFGAFLGILRDPRLGGDDVDFFGFHSVDRRRFGTDAGTTIAGQPEADPDSDGGRFGSHH